MELYSNLKNKVEIDKIMKSHEAINLQTKMKTEKQFPTTRSGILIACLQIII